MDSLDNLCLDNINIMDIINVYNMTFGSKYVKELLPGIFYLIDKDNNKSYLVHGKTNEFLAKLPLDIDKYNLKVNVGVKKLFDGISFIYIRDYTNSKLLIFDKDYNLCKTISSNRYKVQINIEAMEYLENKFIIEITEYYKDLHECFVNKQLFYYYDYITKELKNAEDIKGIKRLKSKRFKVTYKNGTEKTYNIISETSSIIKSRLNFFYDKSTPKDKFNSYNYYVNDYDGYTELNVNYTRQKYIDFVETYFNKELSMEENLKVLSRKYNITKVNDKIYLFLGDDESCIVNFKTGKAVRSNYIESTSKGAMSRKVSNIGNNIVALQDDYDNKIYLVNNLGNVFATVKCSYNYTAADTILCKNNTILVIISYYNGYTYDKTVFVYSTVHNKVIQTIEDAGVITVKDNKISITYDAVKSRAIIKPYVTETFELAADTKALDKWRN